MTNDQTYSPVIIVTGASSGLGEATARAAARLGAAVVLAARSTDRLETISTEIRSQGGQALAVPVDISQEAGCRDIIRRTLDRFGRIDSLVNNAGTIEPIGPIAETSPQQWQDAWAVNVQGAVVLTTLTVPHLRQTRGRVLFITTGSTGHPFPGWAAYITSKAAVEMWMRILALEEPDLTVLCFRPGVVDTPMQAVIRQEGKGRMAEANYQRLYDLYRQGKLIPPATSARLIACLALQSPHAWSGETLQWDDEKGETSCKS